jgi:FeS assembly SUF system protein
MMDTSSHTIELGPSSGVEEMSTSGTAGDGLTTDIIGALRTVHDPEIPVNVFDLGLIYRIEVKDEGLVEIDMTLTAPGCPVASEMVGWVSTAVSSVEGVAAAKVNLVFDPPWDQSRMSEEAKLELGLS